MNEYFPTVVQVIPLDNFHVQVFFDDGKIVDYDATEDLKTEIFKPLRDIDAFKEACTVMNGTLAWDLSGNRDESSCICLLYTSPSPRDGLLSRMPSSA